MKVTKTYCDIKDCDEYAVKSNSRTSVTFTTDQTDGKSAKPYIDIAYVDLCQDHYDKYVILNPLVGAGAQGNNVISFRGE